MLIVFENFVRIDEYLPHLGLVGPVDAYPGVPEAPVVHYVHDSTCMENILCRILLGKYYMENILLGILIICKVFYMEYYMENILLGILITWKVFYIKYMENILFV